jgi:hypothetical protein
MGGLHGIDLFWITIEEDTEKDLASFGIPAMRALPLSLVRKQPESTCI